MPSQAVLRPALLSRLGEIGHADIVVGIPSYNNAGSIAHVLRAVSAGVQKYFPGLTSVVLNSDGGSTDGTPERAQDTNTGDMHSITRNARRAFAPKASAAISAAMDRAWAAPLR